MSLESYATPGGAPLFQDATDLPEFFQNNLQDPAREVKVFYQDPQANIRIFYYQYLKLCFESENVNYNQYIGKIEQVINDENFRFMFYEEADPQFYNDLKFKQLIMEFFGVLGSGKYSVEEALGVYRVVDQVFIAFMRSIMVLTGNCDNLDGYLPWRDTFDFLSNYFAVEIAFHDNCLKFVDTDIFVYQDTEDEVFMAYMDFAKLQRQEEEAAMNRPQSHQPAVVVQSPPVEIKPPTPVVQPPSAPVSVPKPVVTPSPPDPVIVDPRRDSSSMRASQQSGAAARSSYIQSEFVDYTGGSTLTNYGKQMTGSGIQSKSSTLKEMDKANISGSGLQSVQGNAPKPVAQQQKQQDPLPKSVQEPLIKSHPKPAPLVANPIVPEPVVKKEPSYTPPPQTQTQSMPFGPQIQQQTISSSSFQSDYASKVVTQSQTSWQSSQYYQPNTVPPPTPATATYPNHSSKPVIETYKPQYQTYTPLVPPTPPPVGKNPFNLNVSQQFTNSFTMRAMSQPFKSNVQNIRQKARIYRNSLRSHF